ncbi:MAG: DDE-type integrase/transposase/recombinase, partial [Streptococcus thermophilus]
MKLTYEDKVQIYELRKQGKNRYYSPKLKQEMIDKILLEGCSQQSVCLDYGLSNQGLLNNWIAQYKNGYTIVEKTRGRPPKMGRKRKYSSYQGEVGKKADDLIQRQFEASKLMEKCYTDVTEFAIPASSQKLYLSPVLDGFNSEIVAYNLSRSPNLVQVKAMIEQAFTEDHYENTSLYS